MLERIALQHRSFGAEAGDAEGGENVGGHQGVEVEFGLVKRHRVVRWHAGLPIEGLEVICDGANDVGGAVEQIHLAVTIEINSVLHPAGGHELRHAHGPGEAAAQAHGVGLGAVGQAQILLQLALEKLAALLCTRMRIREIKRQRGQCVDHSKVTGLLSKNGLHANDANDDFRRHAVFILRPGQCRPVGSPELYALLDAVAVDVAGSVNAPVFCSALGGWRHVLDRLRHLARLTNRFSHPVRVQIAACGDVIGQLHGLLKCAVGWARQRWFRGGLRSGASKKQCCGCEYRGCLQIQQIKNSECSFHRLERFAPSPRPGNLPEFPLKSFKCGVVAS